VPTYAKVRYASVYPGVDLVYYGNQRQLEYDFIVAPGASAKSIRLRFAGAEKLSLTDSGDLTIKAKDGEIAFHKPVAYQEINGKHEPILGQFALLSHNTVGFTIGSYNSANPLSSIRSLHTPHILVEAFLLGLMGLQWTPLEMPISPAIRTPPISP